MTRNNRANNEEEKEADKHNGVTNKGENHNVEGTCDPDDTSFLETFMLTIVPFWLLCTYPLLLLYVIYIVYMLYILIRIN